jgi:hypothetical protein
MGGSLLAFEAPTSPAEGIFERDSLIWTFGKFAELTLNELFRSPHAWGHYSGWLAEEASELTPQSAEDGLLLMELELNPAGRLTVMALPRNGHFVITICHQQFRAVIASTYGLCPLHRQQHGVCLSHFDGDAGAATRWAVAMQTWLREKRPGAMPQVRSAATLN